MVRRSMPWCLVLAVLVLLGPGVALACPPDVSPPWTKRTPDGRFELSMKGSGASRIVKSQLTLKDRSSGVVLWTNSIDGNVVFSEDALITPNGAAVLLLNRFFAKLELYGSTGKEVGSWDLGEVLTRSELERLPRDRVRCTAQQWVTDVQVEGNAFTLVMPVGAPVGQAHETRYVTVRITSNGAMTRMPVAISRTPVELILMYRQDESPLERLHLADELWSVSRGGRSKVPYEVPRFWMEVLADPKTPRAVRPIAVAALGTSGADADLRDLARSSLGVPEQDALILEVLSRRLPDEAGSYAVRVLEQHHPSPHVRASAAKYLLEKGGAGAKLVLPFVQRDGVLLTPNALPFLLRELEATRDFWQALPFCEDSTPPSSAAAARSLMRALRSPQEVGAVLSELTSPLERTLQTGCPEALILLGAGAEQQGHAELASRLYSLGVAEVEQAPDEQRSKDSRPLVLGAKLRLASMAKKAGDSDELRRLVNEVLSDSSRSTPLCSSQPTLFGPEVRPEACGKQQSAEALARQLLREKNPGPLPY